MWTALGITCGDVLDVLEKIRPRWDAAGGMMRIQMNGVRPTLQSIVNTVL